MKHIRFYLIMMLALIAGQAFAQKYVLTSVADKNASHFDSNVSEIVFGTTAANKSVTFSTNLNISAVSNASWCTVTVKGKTVHFAVTANPDQNERQASVSLLVKDGHSRTLKVRQFGSNPAVYATPTEIKLTDASEFSFEVASSVAPTFQCPEWITPAGPAAAIGTNVYKFKLSEMTDVASRTDYITVGGNGAEAVKVKVTQETQKWPSFAVISDVHFGNSMGEGPMVKVPRALKNLSSQKKLDAIFVVGDLADNGYPEQYEQLVQVFTNEDNFVNPIEQKIFMCGNHDNYSNTINYQNGLKPMNNGEAYPYDQYLVIKGYPFIVISDRSSSNNDDGSLSDGENAYPKSVRDTLALWLERAAKDFPGKPIFVFTHIPPKNTCYSSWKGEGSPSWPTWAMETLNPILNKYPQAVVFSGHSHYSIADPRSIHQGVNPNSDKQNYFTVINTGSTTYSEIESPAVDEGLHPAGYENVTEGLIVSVQPSGNVLVQRYDTERNEEIGADNPWTLKAPFDGSMFDYADTRDQYDNVDGKKLRDGLPAPAFAEGAKIEFQKTPSGVIATFPQAKNNDVVFRYLVRAVNENGLAVKNVWAFSGYFKHSGMPEKVSAEVSGLEEGKQYTITVEAYDVYGNKSSRIVSDKFTVGKSTAPEDMPPARFGYWNFKDQDDPLKCVEGTAQLLPGVITYAGTIEMKNSLEEAEISYTESGNEDLSALSVPMLSTFKVVTGKALPTYTLMYDVRIADAQTWHTLLQANSENSEDADFCINRTDCRIGLGVSDFGYAGFMPFNEWHRIVLRVKDGVPTSYLDGTKLLQGTGTSDDRWMIGEDGFFVFCDNDGDDGQIDVAALALWDEALTDMQIANLGGYAEEKEDEDSEVPASIGHWDFKGDNPLKNADGDAVELVPGTVTNQGEVTLENDIASANIAYAEDPGAAGTALFVPKNSTFMLSANSGFDTYTLMYDVRVSSLDGYHTLLQTNTDNTDGSNDADMCIRPSGEVGLNVSGFGYGGSVPVNTWKRVVVSVKDGLPTVYVDGEKAISASDTNDGRWNLQEDGCYLFCDNDGEDNDIEVASLRFWNVALNASQVATLGGVLSAGNITANVKKVNMREQNEFEVTVTADTEFSFELPDWIHLQRTVPSIGTYTYAFLADEMTEIGSRSAEIIIRPVEGSSAEPVSISVTQTKSSDEAPEATARWTFDEPLALLDCQNPDAAYMQAALIGDGGALTNCDSHEEAGIVEVTGPSADNKAIRVPSNTALSVQLEAESEERLTDFAIMYDFRVPEAVSGWCGFLQTTLTNDDDADLCLYGPRGTMGSGNSGWYYDGYIGLKRWYRVVMNVVGGVPSLYINGELISTGERADDRYTLDPNGFLLFCDNDGETADLDVAEVAWWNTSLTSKQIANLGSIDYSYIYVEQEEVEVNNKNMAFSLDIESSVAPKFDLPDWITALGPDPVAGNQSYRFQVEAMTEAGSREGNITITSADASVTVEPVVIPVKQTNSDSNYPTPTASWDFEDESDLLKATIGTATLEPYNVEDNGAITKLNSVDEMSITSIEGPSADNKAITLGKNSAFYVALNNAQLALDYTIMLDVRRNVEEMCSLFQTNSGNDTDGDLFIKPDGTIGVGVLGYENNIELGNWYRIVLSVKGGVPTLYVNGEFVSALSYNLSRYELDPEGFFLFCDEDGELSDIDVSSIMYWNKTLTADQVESLGKVPGAEE